MKLELSLYNGFKTIEEFNDPTNEGKCVDFKPISRFQWTYGGLRIHEDDEGGWDKHILETITAPDGTLLIKHEGYLYSDFQVRPNK